MYKYNIMNMTQNQTLTQQIEQLLQQSQIQLQEDNNQFKRDKRIVKDIVLDELIPSENQLDRVENMIEKMQRDYNEAKSGAIKEMLNEIVKELRLSEEVIDFEIKYNCHKFFMSIEKKEVPRCCYGPVGMDIYLKRKEKGIIKMIEMLMPTKKDFYILIYLNAMNRNLDARYRNQELPQQITQLRQQLTKMGQKYNQLKRQFFSIDNPDYV